MTVNPPLLDAKPRGGFFSPSQNHLKAVKIKVDPGGIQ